MNEQKIFYRRHLPHLHPPGATYHVVFRLAGSLPKEVVVELRNESEATRRRLERIKDEKEKERLLNEHEWIYFKKFDALLDRGTFGPTWLKQPQIAITVKEDLHCRDGKECDLLAYSIMPNHVHVVFELVGQDSSRAEENGRAETRPTFPVTNLLRLIKGSTARTCNDLLYRSGAFWQHESYDHVIRSSQELERTIWYVLNNPVKAGLVNSWKGWEWTYCKPGLIVLM